jgi:L-alanine-DL-glutamate epimerase-like enolase superfamily enzyme
MRIASVEHTTVSVPYAHREVSSQVARDGVTDILIKVTTEDDVVGWGEACSGADVRSVAAALEAMIPIVVGRDAWNGDAIRADLFRHGLWQFRPMTANFAWAGIDMALWDIRGRAARQPVYRLLGGLRRPAETYFYYLAQGDPGDVAEQCRAGRAAGFDVFYLKVGIDFGRELAMVAAAREALGDGPLLRLDANGSWAVAEARRYMHALAPYGIDFVEQPVREEPIALMQEIRGAAGIAVAANEGLWTEAQAYERIRARCADVFCFSPYWVGSLGSFQRLAYVAHLEGLLVCKHTHGELGVAAAACQHVLLTIPNAVRGHQQTAHLMVHDVLTEPVPIASGPSWGPPDGPGLGLRVDEDAVAEAAQRYARDGQFLPYQREQLGAEDRR